MDDLETRAEELADRLRLKKYAISQINNAVHSHVAAELLGNLAERMMRTWRRDGIGPSYYMLGRSAWYRLVDLIEYLDTKTNGSERHFAADTPSSPSQSSLGRSVRSSMRQLAASELRFTRRALQRKRLRASKCDEQPAVMR